MSKAIESYYPPTVTYDPSCHADPTYTGIISQQSYNFAYAPAGAWATAHIPEVIESTKEEVLAGYPGPSYMHASQVRSCHHG